MDEDELDIAEEEAMDEESEKINQLEEKIYHEEEL